MRGLFLFAAFMLVVGGVARAESDNPRAYSQDVRYEFPGPRAGKQEGRAGCYYNYHLGALVCPQPDDCYYDPGRDVYTCPSTGPVAKVCHWDWENEERLCEYVG